MSIKLARANLENWHGNGHSEYFSKDIVKHKLIYIYIYCTMILYLLFKNCNICWLIFWNNNRFVKNTNILLLLKNIHVWYCKYIFHTIYPSSLKYFSNEIKKFNLVSFKFTKLNKKIVILYIIRFISMFHSKFFFFFNSIEKIRVIPFDITIKGLKPLTET